jgi:hypothetical protein
MIDLKTPRKVLHLNASGFTVELEQVSMRNSEDEAVGTRTVRKAVLHSAALKRPMILNYSNLATLVVQLMREKGRTHD